MVMRVEQLALIASVFDDSPRHAYHVHVCVCGGDYKEGSCIWLSRNGFYGPLHKICHHLAHHDEPFVDFHLAGPGDLHFG